MNNQSFCCDGGDLQLFTDLDPQSATDSAPAIYFYHPDHLGSTAMVTDLGGRIIQNVVYIPYGEVFVKERNGSWTSPYLFNAKELDEETGLYYYGARYLDPTGAQWLSVDPLFEKFPNISPYTYCHQNPIIFVDPDGRTDYYNLKGKQVFTDEESGDSKLVLTTSSDKEKCISEIQLGNGVPIASNQELEATDKAYELSEKTSEHLEEGFYVGTKGTVSIIVEGTNGRVSLEDYEPALAELHKNWETVDHNVHVHGSPLPGKTSNTGEPKPSPEDYQNTFGEYNSVHSILGYTKKN